METFKRLALTYSLTAVLACAAVHNVWADNAPSYTPRQVNIPNTSSAAGVGSVRGRVVDSDGQVLPGAVVYISELGTGAVSDLNGFYTIAGVPAGSYTLKVNYVGYQPNEVQVNIADNGVLENDVIMDAGVELEQVDVQAAFQGQRRAVSMQKNGMGIKNVVSGDEVGKFPDSNIGDALKRLPGINVQYDQGEARFGQVRGTSADLTSVTINGNRLPSAEGDTRNVQLDLIPADMVQTIEVSKVVTSDMDGDAIGGAINLVTKQTPYKRLFNATVGTGFNWVSEKPQLNLGLTWGQRFIGDKLGLMAAASFQLAPGGSDNCEFEYEEDDDLNVVLAEAQARQYYVTRQRQSYSLSADFAFNPLHKIAFKGIYNRRDDWENRFRISYKKLSSKESKQKVVLQTKGGSSDNNDARLEKQQTMDFTLDGEHHFGRLEFKWLGSYARASEDRPEERYFGVALSDPFSGTFENEGGKKPYSTKQIAAFDEAKWNIDELSNSNQEIFENEWKARLDFNLPMARGNFGNKLAFGGKFVSKTKERETHCFDYIDAYEDAYGDDWKNHLTSEIRDGFMAGECYPIGTNFIDNAYLGTIDFASLKGEEILEEASGNYHATEKIGSGYIRLDQRLGRKLTAVLGVRLEHTALNYRGFNWIVDENEEESLIETGEHKNDYTNVLPSVLFKLDATDDFKVRLSFTETLSRPKYSALIPCINYSIADEEATIGNPGLDPTTSLNFDFGLEYYFKGVGMVGAGVFYKNVRDVIVDETWIGESAEIPASIGEKYTITKTINAYDADLLGVEVSLQRDFGFITPALKCIGLYGNYTYTHSKTKNYKFEHRNVADGEDIRMTGSPEHSGNASLFYERNGLSLRLSYNVASSFIDEMGVSDQLDRFYDRVNYMDFNASYTFGKRVKTTIYADATNLLNQPLRYYQGTEDRTMQVEYYGVRADLGVKFNF